MASRHSGDNHEHRSFPELYGLGSTLSVVTHESNSPLRKANRARARGKGETLNETITTLCPARARCIRVPHHARQDRNRYAALLCPNILDNRGARRRRSLRARHAEHCICCPCTSIRGETMNTPADRHLAESSQNQTQTAAGRLGLFTRKPESPTKGTP